MEPLIKKGTPVNRNVKDRNRRYAEMLRLRDEGSYFSNEKMREREPLLFDMILGKYLPDSGKILNSVKQICILNYKLLI